jgi:AmmeMemoRadiSam system protein B
MVSDFLEGASVSPLKGRIVGALAPHAGYIYSGKVAGYTFRAIRDQAHAGRAPETVVVLGFSHRAGFGGVALMDGDAIETPLGPADLDKAAAALLTEASPLIRLDYRPHQGEHSAENEIPFVQAALPEAKLVVGLIGDHEERTLDALVSALGDLAHRKRILVVASTDLLHDADYELVTRTDKATLKKVAALDHAGLLASWGYGSQVCCGIGPVVTVMRFAESQGAKEGTVLYYRNSGDDFPESRGSWVVGYGAVVFAAPE